MKIKLFCKHEYEYTYIRMVECGMGKLYKMHL